MAVPDYATLSGIKLYFPDTDFGSDYDNLLEVLITRASRAVDGFLHRHPGAFSASTESVRYFTGNGGTRLWVNEMAAEPSRVEVAESGMVDDASGTGGLYTPWSAADYFLYPHNAPSLGVPYRRLDVNLLTGSKTSWPSYPKGIKITAKWGFSTTTPPEIEHAVIVQVVRWFKRAQQTYQDAGAVTELAQLKYVQELDPDVKNILTLPKFAVAFL